MLTETGRVVAIDSGGIWVETIRRTTCGSCEARRGCGHGLLNSLGDGRLNLIRVLPGDHDTGELQIDHQVRIAIPEDVLLRGSVIVYMLPLLLMLLCAGVARQLAPQGEVLTIAGAAMGIALGFAIVRFHAWRHRDDPLLQPTLLEVIKPPPTVVSLNP